MNKKYPTVEELYAERARQDAESMQRWPQGYYWVYTLNAKGERCGDPMIAEHNEFNYWFVAGVDGSMFGSMIEVVSTRLEPPCK